MACNNYSKDNKKIQIVHDSECSVAAVIHSCKHNAWALFYMEFRCPIDFLFKQTFKPHQFSNSKLNKRKHKNNAVGEKPHVIFIIIIYEKLLSITFFALMIINMYICSEQACITLLQLLVSINPQELTQ